MASHNMDLELAPVRPVDDESIFSFSQMIIKTESPFIALNFSDKPIDFVVGIELEYMVQSNGAFTTAGQTLLTLQSDQIFSLSRYSNSRINGQKRSIIASIPLGADPITFFSKQQITHWFPRKTSLKDLMLFLRTENGNDLVIPPGQSVLLCFKLYHDMSHHIFQDNKTAY
jgi:hypothetical protein